MARYELLELLEQYKVPVRPRLTRSVLDNLLESDVEAKSMNLFLTKGLDPNSKLKPRKRWKVLEYILKADNTEKAKIPLLKALITVGANSKKDKDEEFIPLFEAVASGHAEAVKCLVDKGALDDLHLKHATQGISTLELAKKNNNPEILALLCNPNLG